MRRESASRHGFSSNALRGMFTSLMTVVARTGAFGRESRLLSVCPVGKSGQFNCGSCSWFDGLLRSLVAPAYAKASVPRIGPEKLFEGEEQFTGDPLEHDVDRYPTLSLKHPPADRIVAIGDVHGDVRALNAALTMSGLLGSNGGWAGGSSVLVQVGDQLDRGDSERDIYNVLFRLQDEAPKFGGAVHILLGNHELMNLALDFRYVTKGGFLDFMRNGGVKQPKNRKERTRIPPSIVSNIRALPAVMRARARALSPGGPLAAELARRAQVSVIVGDNVFVHGGLTPQHLTYTGQDGSRALRTLDSLNEHCREYMLGQRSKPQVLRSGKGPVWMRDYSRHGVRPGSAECRMLAETLKLVKAKRMIVGHTPQPQGINSACGGRVWRVDTGMSAAYGGVPEALEISRNGRIKIYTVKGTVQASGRYK